MEKKRKILVLIDWYLPGFQAGGPIQSCANLIGHLKDFFDFSVATSDSDLGNSSPYPDVVSDQWNVLSNGTSVFYFSRKKLTFRNLKLFLRSEDFDVVYLNSFFSRYFTIYPLLILKSIKPDIKILIAPRGMLSSGALNIKPVKKKIFILASTILKLYQNVTWHASTEIEEKEIKVVYGNRSKVMVALNLSSHYRIKRVKRIKQKGCLDLIFLSRISLKKNLHTAINFLAQLDKSIQVKFDIYGMKEDVSYWNLCEKEIQKVGSNIQVSYKGIVHSEMIYEIFEKYHFSILPSLNENYGHSIVESFAAGCPVIISDQTPWKNLEPPKIGWDISLSEQSKFVVALSRAALMEQSEFDEWSQCSYDFAEIIYSNKEVVEQNKQLFLK